MSISFKYPITKPDGSEFKSAKELLDQLNGEATGFYLLSAHGFWHGGLHISDQTTAYAADKHPVRCMADGEVVAYRLNHDYVTSTWGDDPTIATLEYSTSFCLVRHRYESPHKRPAPAATTATTAAAPAAPATASAAPASGAASPANAQATAAQPVSAPLAAAATADQGPQNNLVFYSLYMHLLPYSGYLPSVGPTTTAATRNAPPYWESSHKITGTLKVGCNARNDPANGHIGNPIHVLPADSTVEIQQEQQLELGSKKQAFVQVKILTLGTGNAGTLSVGQLAWISGQSKFLARDLIQPDVFDSVVVCEQPHPISAGDPIGYLGLYETPSAGANGKTSRKQVHIELFTGDPQFDDFYANKAGLTDGKKLKVAGTDVAPAAMSSTTFTPGSDRLILSVVVDVTPALAKPDAQHKNWFPVQGIGDNGVLSGYVAESQLKDVVQYDWEKLGFRKVEETNDNADGYMDPEKVPAFFKKIYSLIDRNTDNDITPDELLAANQNPVVRDALAHVIAKHPSEWQGTSGAPKWNVLKDKDALLKNNPKRLQHEQERIDKLTWWDDVNGVTDFPTSPNAWHFNPAIFLENMMRKNCRCGCCLGKIFDRVRWHGHYGPQYKGNRPLSAYKGWASLIASGQATDEDREIIVAMSANEGNLDAVQSYDSEIATAGAMQKTINSQGNGEFSDQVLRFQTKHPQLYTQLFSDCGWSVKNEDDEARLYFQDDDTNGQPITGSDLKLLIRKNFTAAAGAEKKECKSLAAIVNALNNECFQDFQVTDFIGRLKNIVLKIKPSGYTYTLDEYLLSPLGKATALDHHVNRPSNVKPNFGAALQRFFISHPLVASDPATWGTSHPEYEKAILDDYGYARSMNDAALRYNGLVAKLGY